jgi:hypothetical protein
MAHPMSALGQKRTSETHAHNVRFTPESGHKTTEAGMSAFSQKRTFDLRFFFVLADLNTKPSDSH